MTVARGFARPMAGVDARTEVPPPGLISSRQRWCPTSERRIELVHQSELTDPL